MAAGAVPAGVEVSLPAVAEEFKLAGANIWNVAVAAGVAAARLRRNDVTSAAEVIRKGAPCGLTSAPQVIRGKFTNAEVIRGQSKLLPPAISS